MQLGNIKQKKYKNKEEDILLIMLRSLTSIFYNTSLQVNKEKPVVWQLLFVSMFPPFYSCIPIFKFSLCCNFCVTWPKEGYVQKHDIKSLLMQREKTRTILSFRVQRKKKQEKHRRLNSRWSPKAGFYLKLWKLLYFIFLTLFTF